MVEDIQLAPLPRALNTLHGTVMDIYARVSQTTPTRIDITELEDIWLIKVNKDRCPVCGTVEKSKKEWCDPRPDNFWEDCL